MNCVGIGFCTSWVGFNWVGAGLRLVWVEVEFEFAAKIPRKSGSFPFLHFSDPFPNTLLRFGVDLGLSRLVGFGWVWLESGWSGVGAGLEFSRIEVGFVG